LSAVIAWARLAAAGLASMLGGTAAAQNPYSYVKFSLGVPWALYFVFLALVTVPFAVMILLAWRRGRGEDETPQSRPQESVVPRGALPDNDTRT
jgi:hypothetical protein